VTGSDAIVLAPWLMFAIGVTAICLRLGISRHPSRRPRRPRPDGRSPDATTVRHFITVPGAAGGVVSRSDESSDEGCKDGARSS
jgi:hypothetical protein